MYFSFLQDLPVIEYWPAGETKVFTVDTSEAGCGALGVLPSREQEVEYSIEPQPGTKNQLVSITPLTTGPHIVDFLFGGRNIPNGTLRFEVPSLFYIDKHFYFPPLTLFLFLLFLFFSIVCFYSCGNCMSCDSCLNQ